MSNQRRVVITGLGVVSPIGCDPDSYWQALSEGKSGVQLFERLVGNPPSTSIGGEVREFTGAIEDYGELEKSQKKDIRKARKLMCREIEMGVAVAQKSLQHAGVSLGQLNPDRTGVIYGCDYIMTEPAEFTQAVVKCSQSESFDYDQWGDTGLGEITPLWLLKYLPNMPASHIAIYNDFRGPNNSITLREASSNLAIGEAYCTISRDSADAVVAGATGTRIHPIRTIHTAMQEQLADCPEDPGSACKPFDRNRTGQVLGEGAGAILLEEYESAKERDADIYAEVVGFGSTTVVDQDMNVQLEQAFTNAIRAALRSANMKPEEIGHINAHGLASISSDQAEAQAIFKIFDQGSQKVPVVAPKSFFGNLGAASGLVELVGSVLALRNGHLFQTLNYDNPDPECPIHVVTSSEVNAGDSALNLSISPFGQASAVVIKKVA